MDKFEREARVRPGRHQPVPSQYRIWWGHGPEVSGKGGVWFGGGERGKDLFTAPAQASFGRYVLLG